MTKVNCIKDRKNKARILIVDDHPMLRERLVEVINRENDLQVCGEAEDHHAALDLVKSCAPDLMVVDIQLKRSNGLDLIKDLQVQHPVVRILVISMHEEGLYAERALRAGAHGYITKQKAGKDILAAIRKVLTGEIYMSQSLAARIACKITGHKRNEPGSPEHLSDRELRVFELIGQGYRVPEIAEKLHLDPKTIETYRMRIKEKLNLKDANEVLKQAIQWGRGFTGKQTLTCATLFGGLSLPY